MDFFNTASDPATDAVSIPHSDDKSDVSDFAQAIADRFGRSASIFTARLPHHHPIVPRPAHLPNSPSGPPAFPHVLPLDLDQWLHESSALIVDIRPHAAYTSARIPHSISLCVPSTLLKRPLFSLQKLCAMLPSPSARTRFSAWRSSSRIIVYDADSHTITDTSNICGLLRKFKSDGFQGELAWLRGGFQAVWRDRRDIVDTNPPEPENDDDDDDHDKSASQSNLLRTRHLPMAAFSLSSTAIHGTPFSSNKQRQQQQQQQLGRTSSQSTSSSSFHASNPFFDAIRQNVELSHGITERIPLQLPQRVRRRIKDLPFPWLQDIAKRAANAPAPSKPLSDTSTTSDSESGDDLHAANVADIEEGKEALANQFHKIELAEQKRLMGIMERHSRESGQFVGSSTGQTETQKSVSFPFSITAGVEKGTKNRYRHIWPFEHARVRLHHSKDTDDDYVNASYVQPLGTGRRYIATQGPLPATFTDFWTLCWEQNVHVIVMLTREVEGTMVKCGSYWTDTDFGPLRLRLVSTAGLTPPEERPHTAHPTSQAPLASSSSSKPKPLPHSAGGSKAPKRYRRNHHYRAKRSETVKRTFELFHMGYPEAKPRRIVHLQYLEWPDMNVPDDPRGVLGLIKQVDEAVRETKGDVEDELVGENRRSKRRRRKAPISVSDVDEKTGIAKHALGANSPVLLHCSAGVGRTGGFIAVDAVLDAIRHEIRARYRAKKEALEKEELERQDEEARNGMDVDGSPNLRELQKDLPKTVPVEISSGMTSQGSSDQSTRNGRDDNGLNQETLVVHLPLAATALAMEVDQTQSEHDGSPEDASSPSPPPPDRHKFNKAGTIRWAENVRDETGVEGERVSESQELAQDKTHSESQHEHAPSQPYASTSSSRTGSTPELVVLTQSTSNGDSSGSSVSGDRTSRSSGSGGVYLTSTSTSLGTSVSGASTSSIGGGSKEKVDVQGSESEGGSAAVEQRTENMKGDGNHDSGSSRSSSSQPQRDQNTTSSLSSCAMSSEGEGESPSRSRSPEEEDVARPLETPRSRGPLQLQYPITIPHPERQGIMDDRVIEVEGGDVYASEASAAATIEAMSTTETVGGGGGAFDYKEPRPLHEDYTPPPLSTFEDPIWEVIQDMREQRMSLCQSLRQYVFVHAAVIEGSLMVWDEEKEIADGFGGWRVGEKDDGIDEQEDEDGMRMRTTPEADDPRVTFTFSSPPPPSSSESGTSTPSISSVSGIGHSPLPSRSPSRSRSRSNSARRRHHHYHHHLPPPPTHSHSHISQSQPFLYSSDTVVPPAFAPSYGPYGHTYTYGKRPSSPTELLKEDKKGEVMLSKRPSIERKRKNTVGEGDSNARVSAIASGSGTCGGAQERGSSVAPS